MTCNFKEKALNKNAFRAPLRSGFTLIEVLVVVLIIGILAAIALPQYQRAVEKSRLTEALQNVKLLEECFDWYILEHGLSSSGSVFLEDMNCPIEINLGNKDYEDLYTNENFEHLLFCSSRACQASISRMPSYDYTLDFYVTGEGEHGKRCITQLNDKGRDVCRSIENLGWNYEEGEW